MSSGPAVPVPVVTGTGTTATVGAMDRDVRVFLVDDHEMVRRGLADLLES
jgi:hypothetical protein